MDSSWSLNKSDVVLHEIYDQGIGRLDCDTEEVLTDDDTIFCKDEPQAINVSCVSMSPNTKVKQVSTFHFSSINTKLTVYCFCS